MEKKIDFVILWVDGSDPEWIAERNLYSKEKMDINDARFRDWETLKYLFRSIDNYAPWVNNVFFITWRAHSKVA